MGGGHRALFHSGKVHWGRVSCNIHHDSFSASSCVPVKSDKQTREAGNSHSQGSDTERNPIRCKLSFCLRAKLENTARCLPHQPTSALGPDWDLGVWSLFSYPPPTPCPRLLPLSPAISVPAGIPPAQQLPPWCTWAPLC